MTDEKESIVKTHQGNSSGGIVDTFSPYYLYPFDNPGHIFVSNPLNGENYPSWRRSMQNALHAKNKIGFVDGSIEKPDIKSPLYENWIQCNSMVLAWLLNAVKKDIHDSVAYVETAYEVCADLQERFSQGNAPRVYQLKRKLSLFQQDEMSITTYYTKLRGLWDELQAYNDIPTCSCGSSKKLLELREMEKLYNFRGGLNSAYATVRSQILNMTPLPNLGKVYSILVQEEKQQLVATHRSPHMKAKGSASAQKQNTVNRSTCEQCGKPGHIKEIFFELVGYPSWWKTNVGGRAYSIQSSVQKQDLPQTQEFCQTGPITEAQSTMGTTQSSPIAGLNAAQYQQLISLLNGGKASNFANLFGKSVNNNVWIIDSGASDHMTNNEASMDHVHVNSFIGPVRII